MKKLILLLSIFLFVTSCGIYRPTDARKVPVNANERVKKNMEEGRGFRIANLGKRGGDFMFSSSNPLWRASMDKLSFAPLSVVDYGGGIIITDWFSEEGNNEEIKIAVRFLSNEIRSDSLKIVVHKKNCKISTNCRVALLSSNSKLHTELLSVILKKASLLEIKNKRKKKKK